MNHLDICLLVLVTLLAVVATAQLTVRLMAGTEFASSSTDQTVGDR